MVAIASRVKYGIVIVSARLCCACRIHDVLDRDCRFSKQKYQDVLDMPQRHYSLAKFLPTTSLP